MTDNTSPRIRVRFAPSPTGLLHIGGLRTALYNYLLARQKGGAFILRIEDTDRTRYVEEAEGDILDSLRWAGLDFDEGPGKEGAHTPYYQSQRSDLYKAYAQQLLDAGRAYYAFDTPEELAAMRERLTSPTNPAPRYDAVSRKGMKNALTLSPEEVKALMDEGVPHVVRLKVPEGETVRFHDQIRGDVAFKTSEIDDQVLLKSDGMPTYHLANVVDDHLMEVTHVIRGEEWLPSTPKHILLYQAFGWQPPQMAHLPLILSPTGGKLSKRNAEKMGIPVSVRQYREAGYEPSALINFLAMLGWNPGDEREVFQLPELTDAFSIERVGSSGVQFNLDKLRWYNQQFLRLLPVEALMDKARPLLAAEGFHPDEGYLRDVVELMQDRISFAEELSTTCRFFYEDPTDYEERGVKKRWKDDSATLLLLYADQLEALTNYDEASIEATLRSIAESEGVGSGRLIHPARLAVSGRSSGPSLFHMMAVLGRDTCIRRLRQAVGVLG